MEAIFWITLLLNVASKAEPVDSQGLKNHKGKLFFFFVNVLLYSRLVILTALKL